MTHYTELEKPKQLNPETDLTNILNFSDINSLFQYFTTLPLYLNFLLKIVLPEPTIFILNDNQLENHRINVTIRETNQPNFQFDDYYTNIFDCTKDNTVTMVKPGSIKIDELKHALPENVDLLIETKPIFDLSNIKYIDKTEQLADNNFKVILGTKEKLRDILDIELPEYFTQFKLEEKTLINLGSQTNLESVAKNLANNLNLAQSISGDSIAILGQNWGESHWGVFIKSNLADIINDANQTILTSKTVESPDSSSSILSGIINPLLA
jgi:hypothetical protein